jgi:GNAT superfamily N-acetyltransferase
MDPKIIIFPEHSLAEAKDTLFLDDICSIATAEFHGFGLKLELIRGRGMGGPSVAELSDMDNWPQASRHGEPYIFRVRAVDANDRPAGQAFLGWWGSPEGAPRLESIYVVPKCRRRGVASAMVRLVERAARMKPMHSPFLTNDGRAFCGSLVPGEAVGC